MLDLRTVVATTECQFYRHGEDEMTHYNFINIQPVLQSDSSSHQLRVMK